MAIPCSPKKKKQPKAIVKTTQHFPHGNGKIQLLRRFASFENILK